MIGQIEDETSAAAIVDFSLSGGADNVPLPRVSLQKRKANGEIGLTSVNSAFLDGIFSDLADVQQTTQHDDDTATSAAVVVSQQHEPEIAAPPSKKSRPSLTRSISRCPKSFKALGDALFPSSNDLYTALPGDDRVTPAESMPSGKPNFLAYPKSLRSCATMVSDSTDAESPSSFPRLPHAVSVSSCCNTLTAATSSGLRTGGETSSYGWFVEMEDETAKEQVHPYYHNKKSANSKNNLAFNAPTAPKAEDHEADIEWAKAADTVDSVLGDFF